MDKHAVVLLSGGIDSSTTWRLLWRKASPAQHSPGMDNGMRWECSPSIAQTMGITDHRIVDIDLRMFGKSALTDDIAVPSVPGGYLP